MLIVPAIDIAGGSVVRLKQGKLKEKEIYSDCPIEVAKFWQQEGAKLLHIIDIEGAIKGKMQHFELIKNIIEAINIPVQVGGGIRNILIAKKLIEIGAKYIILSTRAILEENFLKELIEELGQDKIKISLDIRKEEEKIKICVNGWQKSINASLYKILNNLEAAKIKNIIFTDINRDGMLEGINIERIKNFLNGTKNRFKVMISGGISSINDIKLLYDLKKKYTDIEGIIIGKALYKNLQYREIIKEIF